MGKLIFSISLLLLLLNCCHGGKVGVCYGRSADDLPTPTKVVQLIKQHNIKYVRIYDYNPQVLKAFSNTTIELIIGVPNSDLKSFSQSQTNADTWLKNSVLPFYPTTKITHITVGAESTDDPHTTNASSLVVPAMHNVLTALKKVGLSRRIKVSTTLSLGVLSRSFPPSAGAFNSSYAYFLRPMLEFLAENQSPFMVDLYPYYAYRDSPSNVSLDYVLFSSSSEVIDPNTGLLYKNMFDAQVDALYYALTALNFRTIKIMVTETGWPTKGSPKEKGAASPDNAETYNGNIIHHTVTNQGTPLKPGEAMDVYIFSLFNENRKTGLDSERNWGLFYPDQTSVYQLDFTGKNGGLRANSSGGSSRGRSESWCIASSNASEIELRGALDWACGPGNVDCTAIQPSQACFQPDTLVSHASFVFNSYFQENGGTDVACSFGGVGVKVNKDPSYDKCIYITAGGNNTKATNASALNSSASTSHGDGSPVWILSLWLVISLIFSLQTMNLLAL